MTSVKVPATMFFWMHELHVCLVVNIVATLREQHKLDNSLTSSGLVTA